MVETSAASELAGRLTPFLVGAVVDNVIGAESTEVLSLGVGGGGRYDASTGSLGNLTVRRSDK